MKKTFKKGSVTFKDWCFELYADKPAKITKKTDCPTNGFKIGKIFS
jgi:hypothetical protein